MQGAIVALPVLPGAEAGLTHLAASVLGPRLADHRASRRSLGILRERWWVHSDDGVCVLLLEGNGPPSGDSLTFSAGAYDEWFTSALSPFFPPEIDWRRPMPLQAQLVYDSDGSSAPMSQTSVLTIPLAAGKTDAFLSLAEEAAGENREVFDNFHARMGLRQRWWVLREPEGDIALMYLESEDLLGSVCGFADSQHVADLWLKQKLLEIQGVDWRYFIPGRLSRLVLRWEDEAAPRVISLDGDRTIPLLRRGRAR